MNGELYLIPCTIGGTPEACLPASIYSTVNKIDHYVVENVRSARRFLRSINIEKPIDQLTFYELGKHTNESEIPSFINPALEGKNIGLISEAGLPAVADPGGKLVAIAQAKNIKVNPLTGPSSILLALMGSGFNGQKFTFHGYLSKDKKEKIQQIKEMEMLATKKGISQIFMDTPFRNQQILDDCCTFLSPKTYMNISVDITLESEMIKTKTVGDWKKSRVSINKRPAIFIIGRPEYLY